ncbi:hypothetical protein HHI36_007914 [Cryptolaemus montrouzieri]|uniref:Uncharacterized protein n=1 Tax=Cryptolaemus montrouzieri TaxID=559131 RepID=A0ABD2MQZ0_9CUCU
MEKDLNPGMLALAAQMKYCATGEVGRLSSKRNNDRESPDEIVTDTIPEKIVKRFDEIQSVNITFMDKIVDQNNEIKNEVTILKESNINSLSNLSGNRYASITGSNSSVSDRPKVLKPYTVHTSTITSSKETHNKPPGRGSGLQTTGK